MASSRAHLINQLNRSRTSSPREEDYATAHSATATSFDVDRDAIHSTMQIPDHTTEQQLPAHRQPLEYDQFPETVSVGGSEGSADMSIELGRGFKRSARQQEEDVSSNAMFKLGSDSMYEVTATPPTRTNMNPRKAEDGLRRQASVRSAKETVKSNGGVKRAANKNSLADAIRQINAEEDSTFVEETAQHSGTFNTRNTRFARSRQTSTQQPAVSSRFVSGSTQNTPRRNGQGNPTAESNQSFMLPDMPNLTELVSGVRKDGTPVFNKNARSRSRFTSGSYKPAKHEYHPVEGYPVPEEEQFIYASLQSLQERIGQLEKEKSEALKRAEEYEGEIIDLRSQLAATQSRPDSGFASDEESSTVEKLKTDKKKLQASVKALEDRLSRAERRISVGDISLKRVTRERDQVVTQIAIAYAQNEQLKGENETMTEEQEGIEVEMDELKAEMEALRQENKNLRASLASAQESADEAKARQARKEAKPAAKKQNRREASPDLGDASQRSLPKRTTKKDATKTDFEAIHRMTGRIEDLDSDDLAIRIAREVEKARVERRQKDETSQSKNVGQARLSQEAHNADSRSRSKSATRQQARPPVPHRNASGPIDQDVSGAESTTQLDMSETRNSSKRTSLPASSKSRGAVPREEDSRDLTLLSWLDPEEVNKLRKKLEEERRSGRLNSRVSSAPEHDFTAQSTQTMPRKSSLKDVTKAFDEITGHFSSVGDNEDKAAKSVRVQSPHTSDEISYSANQTDAAETSILSNTSRRRRRSQRTSNAADNQTSAFILPDITIQNLSVPSTIPHDASTCTACPHPASQAPIPAPELVPVTAREIDEDVTSATVRPTQPPPDALASVIRRLSDDLTHAKLQLAACQQAYAAHDPALGKRKRAALKLRMEKLTAAVEGRCEVVYGLYDVLEGFKEGEGKGIGGKEVEETLESLGVEGGRVAGGYGLDGVLDGLSEEGDELPWEGISDSESE